MLRTTRPFELKFASDVKPGSFSGYGAVFDNIDDGGDMIVKGAFADTLAAWKAKGKMPKMLWHHGLGMSAEDLLPIGYWTAIEEDDHGLKVEGQLIALDTDRGRTLHEGMMAEAIDAMSITYSVVESSYGKLAGETYRSIGKLDLYEVGPVLWGMNDQAGIEDAKAVTGILRVALTDIGPGDRVQIVNPRIYARKLEGATANARTHRARRRGSSRQAPNGVYRVVQRLVVQRYSKSLFVDFKYVKLNTGMKVWGAVGGGRVRINGKWVARNPRGRAQRDQVYPALQLGYQLNDVFTSAVGGMSPLMIAAQQGPQITQVFGGIGNTLAAIPKPLLIGGGAALGAGAAALGVNALKELNDTLETQKRRLGDMLGDQRLSAQAYADIAKQATAANESIQLVTAQYTSFSRASVFVGATGKEVSNLTSVVSQVGKLGGSSPEEQSAGSAALSRALKESVVSAANLDAILESMPGLGRRIADGLGLSVTQLRLMADAGQITNRQVFDALLSQQQKVDAKFKETGITVGGFFSAALRGAEDLAVSIYKSVMGIELVASKADAARRATAANANRPTRATPRVIGNNGSTLSLDEMVTFGEAGQTDASVLNDPRRLQTQFLDVQRAANAQAPIALALATEAASKANREAKEGLADMQRQVDLAQQQLDIIRTGAPDMAAQLAMLAKKNELVSKGADLSLQVNQDQVTAAGTKARVDEQIQYAKDAADATKRTWQTAYDNIQGSAADTFYDIFSGAGFNAQSAADAMKKVFLRAFAEIAAAAIIRPLITPIFQIGQSAGLIPAGIVPSAAGASGESMNGSSSSTGNASGLFSGGTGGGLGSIFSTGGASGGGWLARQVSGISNFLSTPLYGGPSAAAFEGVMPGMTGAQAQSYFSGLSGGGGLFSGAGPTIGQGIGGIASIGSGIFNLARGGGSTSSMVSGIGQTIGGIVTMLPIPGAQIAGPLISLGASLLGGLFGDSGPKIPPQPALVYGAGQFRPTGTGSFSYTGDSLGSGSPMQSNAETIATDLTKAFRSAGLTVNPSALIGGNIASGIDHVLNGTQWQDRAYTQTGLILPGGGYETLTYNDSSKNVGQASEYLLAQTFRANVLRGGVSGAGEGVKAGLDKINPTTSKDLDNVITIGTAYDKLGKTINPAKDAIDKISASFDALKDYATQAGLSLDPINDELKKQSKRSAQDFIDAMVDPLAVSLRALGDEREQALESAKYIRDNYKDIYVDMDKIATYYTDKEAKLRDDFYSGSITTLQTTIDRLTYGDLANASPVLQLSGAKAAYEAGLAKAQTGDVTAIGDLSTLAADYARAQQLYSGSGPDYEAVRRQIMADLLDEKARIDPSTSTTGAVQPVSTADQATNATIARLSAMLLDLTRKVDTLTDAQTAFTAQARRLASSGAR